MIPKFRAWNEKTKSFINYGDLVLDLESGKVYAGDIGLMDSVIDVTDQIDLMQSTGLKDKNNVEIYEGDIVKRAGSSKPKDELLEIGFANGSFYSTFIPDWCRTSLFDYVDFGKQVEVLGNIYTNPELLEAIE